MAKVLTIGGATLDVIIQYEEMEMLTHQRKDFEQSYLLLEEGKKIEVTEQQNFSGGGATNAAVSFKRQGYEVSLFCKLGQDAPGLMVQNELKGYGLDLSLVCTTAEVGTATSFVVPSLKGDRTVFAYRGANAALSMNDLPLDSLKNKDLIYITSLSRASGAHLPQITQIAKQNKAKVAVNPGVSQLKRGSSYLKHALPTIDTLIVNDEEARQLMVSLLQDENAAQAVNGEGADKLLREQSYEQGFFNLREFFKKVLMLGPSVVVVTYGAKGVYVATSEQLFFHEAAKVEVVNTLGAGDAFGSGFTGAYYGGMNILDAIRAGVVNSASVIRRPDAKTGLLTEVQMLEEIKQLPPDMLHELSWKA